MSQPQNSQYLKDYEQYKRLNPVAPMSFESYVARRVENEVVAASLSKPKEKVTKAVQKPKAISTVLKTNNRTIRSTKKLTPKELELDSFKCTKCNKRKKKTEFYKENTKRGHSTWCKSCKSIHAKQYHKNKSKNKTTTQKDF